MISAKPRFAAVVLAAGLSSRMGDFKPLMDLAGETVLARCVEAFRAAGIGDVVVVTGHRASEVQAEVERLGISAIHNPAYEQGMFSSVRAAVASLSDLDAFFLLPVDIPLVRSATIASLVQAYDGRIAYPCFEGERGHPPLVPARLIPAVLDHDGCGGMKSLLEAHPALDVPVWDQGTLLDADTPDDFAALVRRAERQHVGERAEAVALAALIMPERGVAHGRAVASVALRLGEELIRHGGALDLDLIHNAALLHDLAKGQPGHEKCGGELWPGWVCMVWPGSWPAIAMSRRQPPACSRKRKSSAWRTSWCAVRRGFRCRSGLGRSWIFTVTMKRPAPPFAVA